MPQVVGDVQIAISGLGADVLSFWKGLLGFFIHMLLGSFHKALIAVDCYPSDQVHFADGRRGHRYAGHARASIVGGRIVLGRDVLQYRIIGSSVPVRRLLPLARTRVRRVVGVALR